MSSEGQRTVVVASHNRDKISEIGAILEGVLGGNLVSVGEIGDFPEPEETGLTFEENALIKARAAYVATGLPSIADDSGLEVDALRGAPGVHSARFAGDHDDAANNRLVLEKLADVAEEGRTARFVSAIAFIDETGHETVVRGTVEGRIAQEPRGEHGFGYDPLFLPDVVPGKTMAELSSGEKNAISHRGDALAKMRVRLEGRS